MHFARTRPRASYQATPSNMRPNMRPRSHYTVQNALTALGKCILLALCTLLVVAVWLYQLLTNIQLSGTALAGQLYQNGRKIDECKLHENLCKLRGIRLKRGRGYTEQKAKTQKYCLCRDGMHNKQAPLPNTTPMKQHETYPEQVYWKHEDNCKVCIADAC